MDRRGRFANHVGANCHRERHPRLEAAGALGLPQVVSLGALDMVNFGPRETVPERFAGRNLYVHNPTVTLMRTTPEECGELGRQIGRKLSAAKGLTQERLDETLGTGRAPSK